MRAISGLHSQSGRNADFCPSPLLSSTGNVARLCRRMGGGVQAHSPVGTHQCRICSAAVSHGWPRLSIPTSPRTPTGTAYRGPLTAASASFASLFRSYHYNRNSAIDFFVPRTMARAGAASSLECLSEYSQLQDGSWWLPLADSAGVNITAGVTTFDSCVRLCDQALCQLVTYDYVAKECSVRVALDPVYEG